MFSPLGAFCAFVAFHVVRGKNEVLEIYRTGIEQKNNGIVEDSQKECLGRLLAWTLQALFVVVVGGYLLAALKVRTGEVQLRHNISLGPSPVWCLATLLTIRFGRDLWDGSTWFTTACVRWMGSMDGDTPKKRQ